MKQPTFRKNVLCLSFIFIVLGLQSQEQIGFHTDNYAGINATQLNPAGHANTPFSWDVNIGEAGFFFENNYLFIEPFRLLDATSLNGDEFYYQPDIKDPSEIPSGAIITDFFSDNRKRFANLSYNVLGPSFYARINENNTIGLTTRFRVMATGQGVSDNLSYYTYFAQDFFDGFEIPKFSLGAMVWSELGVNYMHKFEMEGGDLSVAVTLKHLIGFEAAYLYNEKAFQLTKLPGDTLTGNAISFDLGFTNSNIKTTDNALVQNGTGFGMDIGFVYTSRDYQDEYQWKIGFSILDIGKIKFTQNAQQHAINTAQIATLATAEFANFAGTDNFEPKIQFFSEQLLGDSSLSLQNNSFSMWLPTSISVQAEYAFTKNLLLNGTIVQGIPLGGVGVQRGSILAITPRFEQRWLGFALPVSIYNWQDLRVGAALRLAFFTIGSSNLGSIFREGQFTGTDFYLAVKFNPFDVGLRKSGRAKRKGRRRGSLRNVKCYEF